MLEAQNTPKKPVIAVRAGSSLRHVDMALNTPFHVPIHGLQDNRIKVSLYEQLGTQTIIDKDEEESICNVPVRTPDGTCSQVKLRIRRGQPSTGPSFKQSTIGGQEYLNHHQLETRIQSLFEIVLKKQPQDPYRCMIEELKNIKTSGEEAALAAAAPDMSSSTDPKQPVAPSAPPPSNARPSPNKNRNVKPAEGDQDAATKKALAEVMGRQGAESQSLNNARQAQRAAQLEKHSNLTLAHEVMRMCIKSYAAGMSKQSASLGGDRTQARLRAIEHAKNVEVSHHVLKIVMRDAYARLQARAMGMRCSGTSDVVISVRDQEAAKETQSLTKSIMRSYVHSASKMM